MANLEAQSGPSSKMRRQVCGKEVYSLREAAEAVGLNEELLRRDIVLHNVPASEVSDDRHYLIRWADLRDYMKRLRPGEELVCVPEEPLPVMGVLGFILTVVLLLACLAAGLLSEKCFDPSPPPAPGGWTPTRYR